VTREGGWLRGQRKPKKHHTGKGQKNIGEGAEVGGSFLKESGKVDQERATTGRKMREFTFLRNTVSTEKGFHGKADCGG